MGLSLRQQVEITRRRLLSEVNRDPYSATYGCFDRRHWAWKLADFPEATFQRNAAAIVDLAPETGLASLHYTARIQHPDGSFDQAFPHEHSYGATAFLLHPSLETRRRLAVGDARIDTMLRKAADFLCAADETHGRISNHIAGAALALHAAALTFNEQRYDKQADALVKRVLSWQSSEGWFIEYEGADPGYQTLCVYYLAQIYAMTRARPLRDALERAVEFLSWFAHPDGTFGGEYGSRRTGVLYPGGLAVLARELPVARALLRFALRSIENGTTVTLCDVDVGNVAPLLANYLLVLDHPADEASVPLPHETIGSRDFRQAGLSIRSRARDYTIVGLANGGVVKVFDKGAKRALWNDAGHVAELGDGTRATTQWTSRAPAAEIAEDSISLTVSFRALEEPALTPARNVVLRVLNLTIMRNRRLGNAVKMLLVRLLMRRRPSAPLRLRRTIRFGERITIEDRVDLTGSVSVRRLECGRNFVAIHMASARYYDGTPSGKGVQLDVDRLNRERTVTAVIEC